MLKYIVRRIVQMVPVFFGVTILLFILRAPGVLPGDPIRMITGEKAISPALYNQLVKENGLDKPLPVQYVTYLGKLFKGDLGRSYQKDRPVVEIFADKYPNTIRLALAAIVLEIVIGIGAGIISAIKQYSFLDILVTLSTSILVSVPVFWLGMMFQVFFGIKLKEWTGGSVFLPMSGMGSPPDFAHLVLPAVTLASVSTAYAARIMRSQLLEVMGQDYIRTAVAKGLSDRAVVFKHALKNALIPVVTFIGLDLGAMMSGAILTETIFNWPGVGLEIYFAIQQRDWPIVMGGVIIVVFAVMIINLVVDISYAFLDPRIRYGEPAK
ncbi:ABC transporter permease [Coriobacteriia bacterium Es71-Z0120]|uniref:ABC transporter permease n=1 Tax=Parvivirga hydrogeniphila TaxID=2939460 RepID=UPI0022608B00|nr:ABC transporter permease [Parvivirga hydrogeniphila]MCL4078882.1 ABC transporter permease [Parvivirga hydrogeniphila]